MSGPMARPSWASPTWTPSECGRSTTFAALVTRSRTPWPASGGGRARRAGPAPGPVCRHLARPGRREEVGVSAKVTIQPFDEVIDVGDDESVLSAVLRQGRYLKYGCKHGGCGTCRAQLVEGDCRLG